MQMISHDGTAMPAAQANKLFAVTTHYLNALRREGVEWAFDQLASESRLILLVTTGVISEATNWF